MSEPEQWHVAGTVVRNQHDQDICYMAEKNQWEPGCGEIPIEVQIARARLIAAVPELLAKLTDIIYAIRNGCFDMGSNPLTHEQGPQQQATWKLIEEAEAAIRKARGEQP